MNCEQTRRHWHLFHDSEGDAELHHQINEHLAMCPGCAGWFHQQSRLEDGLGERLRAGEPTEAIWERIRNRSCPRAPAGARPWSLFSFSRVVLLAASVLVAVAGIVWTMRGVGPEPGPSPHLSALSAAMHERLATGREPAQFASRSDIEVERYLRRQVGFRVHCPPRKDVDFEVSGAGVCTVNDKTAAYILGKVGPAPVSLFVLDRTSLDAFPHDREMVARGDGRHRCREGSYEMVAGIASENVVVVVGAVPGDTLERLFKAYGSYHESSG